jgi:hypothetical protein
MFSAATPGSWGRPPWAAFALKGKVPMATELKNLLKSQTERIQALGGYL